MTASELASDHVAIWLGVALEELVGVSVVSRLQLAGRDRKGPYSEGVFICQELVCELVPCDSSQHDVVLEERVISVCVVPNY